ncbi:RNA methyltransferase, RsmE family [Leptospira inadai serovar Lyme str. 10]|uniref:Ribosomal RNA small subunit methyltransferase E n=2 Tax=Leptospira inadai serovar Lyme TaxID=293084 RepID=V6HJR9_9LEPT|nr:RsmE family RNA methyltransferase [Leptospira inadai]EQA37140.1 RNA methyltransferase, RsmE family [Leptospira inadai serovar Lyme str. 10]PNV76546.1 16S rRNA methyltransferase [Leptospira inadai serovar Lyme]
MNILLLSRENETEDKKYKISDPIRINHISNILNKNPSDSIKAGILNESLGKFKIVHLDPRCILGKYVKIIVPKRRTPSLSLFSAVQRPPTVEKILHLAGTWGIESIEFYATDLSRNEYLTSPIWKSENFRVELRLGMEQGWNVFEPSVSLGFSIPSAKERIVSKAKFYDVLPDFSGSLFYLDRKGDTLESLLSTRTNIPDAGFLLGPEPGWSKKERKRFRELGASPIKVSSAILRSENALAFLLAQWELILKSKGIGK